MNSKTTLVDDPISTNTLPSQTRHLGSRLAFVTVLAVSTCVSTLSTAVAAGQVAPLKEQEKVAGMPVDDLSKAHDYDTVDIKTLNVWERTFLPEWRKKPIFDAMLNGVKWKQHVRIPDGKNEELVLVSDEDAVLCDKLLSDLQNWNNVEFIEPEFSANRYVAPEFDEWRRRCPKMVPHRYSLSVTIGTHNFKSYRLPELAANERLFYVQGNAGAHYMDAAGRLIPKSSMTQYLLNQGLSFKPDGQGHYSIVDLEQCKKVSNVPGLNTRSFEYYSKNDRGLGLYRESAVFRIAGQSYVVSGHASNPDIDKERRLKIANFNRPDRTIRRRYCTFSYGDYENQRMMPELYEKD